MNEGLIPKRYAKALYKFAVEKKADNGLYRMMGNLGKSFADNPALNSTVANPFVADSDKIALLTTAAEMPAPVADSKAVESKAEEASSAAAVDKEASSSVVKEVYADFLKLLSHNSRLAMAAAIARAYCAYYRAEHHIYKVRIVSAMPLDEPERARLGSLIDSHLGGATAEYNYSVDPDLIGGFTVDIDNERLDASVKNELKQLRLKLLHHA